MSNDEQSRSATISADATEQERMLQIMVTEHTALQTARSGTIFEANGRVSLYIGAISSALVAIALIGQVSEMGNAFYIITLVLLPPLYFIGLVTSERTLQISIEDIFYARNINRIHHFYTEIVPASRQYFMLSTHDDTTGFFKSLGAKPSRFQIFLTTGGLVIGINSLLLGIFFAVLAHVLFKLELLPCTFIGAIGLVVNFVIHIRNQDRRWSEFEATTPVIFPTPNDEKA
jgi:hypothetical protein